MSALSPAPPSPSAPASSLLRHPDFLRLWTAETISQLGTQVSALAIPFVAIEILEATTFQVALLNVVDFLPFLLIGLPAGVWVDRLRRRPVMIAGDLGRAAALATIPVAFVLGVLTIAQLYVVGFLVGVLTVFFDVAYQSYLPSVVARDQLQEGNAKLEVSRAGAAVVGPGLAGLLIGTLRAPLAVALDALNIAACTATANLFGTVATSVLLVFAVRELGMTAGSIGVAFSIGATGALLGALTANRVSTGLGVGPTIIAFGGVSGLALLPLALAPVGTPQPVLVVLVALAGFVTGVATVVYNVAQVSLRQAITPTRMQGRMNATMRWFVWGTIPIGGILGGALGTLLGVREAVLIGALGGMLAIVPVLFSPVRAIREMPAPADDEAVASDYAIGGGPPA